MITRAVTKSRRVLRQHESHTVSTRRGGGSSSKQCRAAGAGRAYTRVAREAESLLVDVNLAVIRHPASRGAATTDRALGFRGAFDQKVGFLLLHAKHARRGLAPTGAPLFGALPLPAPIRASASFARGRPRAILAPRIVALPTAITTLPRCQIVRGGFATRQEYDRVQAQAGHLSHHSGHVVLDRCPAACFGVRCALGITKPNVSSEVVVDASSSMVMARVVANSGRNRIVFCARRSC